MALAASEMRVTGNRAKWTDTSGMSPTIAHVTGSRQVLEDGVSIPNRCRATIGDPSPRLQAFDVNNRRRPFLL